MTKQLYFKQFSLVSVHSFSLHAVKISNSSISNYSIYQKCIVEMSNSYFLPIDKTLAGVSIPGQSGPGSDGNEGVLYISLSSSITEASPSDCLVSYTRTLVGGGGLTLLQRCSRCILQPQPARPLVEGVLPFCRDAVGVFYSPWR